MGTSREIIQPQLRSIDFWELFLDLLPCLLLLPPLYSTCVPDYRVIVWTPISSLISSPYNLHMVAMVEIAKDPSILSSLLNKTAIITGGANGIGASTVRLLHSQGCNVVIADLGFAKATAEALIFSLPAPTASGAVKTPRVIYVETDILDWTSMKNLFKETVKEFGQVDIVVANAGLMESRQFFDWDDVDEEGDLRESREAFKVLDVNLKGTMNSMLPFS
jgi:hypothetical protein